MISQKRMALVREETELCTFSPQLNEKSRKICSDQRNLTRYYHSTEERHLKWKRRSEEMRQQAGQNRRQAGHNRWSPRQQEMQQFLQADLVAGIAKECSLNACAQTLEGDRNAIAFPAHELLLPGVLQRFAMLYTSADSSISHAEQEQIAQLYRGAIDAERKRKRWSHRPRDPNPPDQDRDVFPCKNALERVLPSPHLRTAAPTRLSVAQQREELHVGTIMQQVDPESLRSTFVRQEPFDHELSRRLSRGVGEPSPKLLYTSPDGSISAADAADQHYRKLVSDGRDFTLDTKIDGKAAKGWILAEEAVIANDKLHEKQLLWQHKH